MISVKRLRIFRTKILLASAVVLTGFVGNVQAQVFDLNTYTLTLPRVTVGTNTYSLVLHYDSDGRLSITQVATTIPSIVGTWYADGVASGLSIYLTFKADGTYLMLDNGNTISADPNGQPGIEVGTYTYNPTTGAFSSACPTINTDGEWGLSHGRQGGGTGCTGSGGTVTIQGNTLTFIGNDGSFTLTRVAS